MSQVCRRDIDKIALSRMAVLPIDRVTWRVGEPFQLAQGFGQHSRVVLFVDNPVVPLVFFEQGWCQTVKAKSTATVPANSFSYASFVAPVNYALYSRNNMSVTMLAQFDLDPVASHFMCNCTRCARAREGI